MIKSMDRTILLGDDCGQFGTLCGLTSFHNEGIKLLNHHKACTWCFQIFSVIGQLKAALFNASIRLEIFVFLYPKWSNLKITVLVAKAVT